MLGRNLRRRRLWVQLVWTGPLPPWSSLRWCSPTWKPDGTAETVTERCPSPCKALKAAARCVPRRSDAVISWAAKRLPQSLFVMYEQIRPDDPFGRVMQDHFLKLNSTLHALQQYPDLLAQRQRFLDKASTHDMTFTFVVYRHKLWFIFLW